MKSPPANLSLSHQNNPVYHGLTVPLNPHGYLPGGIYICSLEEVRDVFAVGNEHREHLFYGLERFLKDHQELWSLIKYIYIDGSFISAKNKPRDIDVVIELPTHTDESELHLFRQIRRQFLNLIGQKPVILQEYRIDLMWCNKNDLVYDPDNFLDYVQTITGALSLHQSLPSGFRKGIVRVTP